MMGYLYYYPLIERDEEERRRVSLQPCRPSRGRASNPRTLKTPKTTGGSSPSSLL